MPPAPISGRPGLRLTSTVTNRPAGVDSIADGQVSVALEELVGDGRLLAGRKGLHQKGGAAEATLWQRREGYDAEQQFVGRSQKELLGPRLVEHQGQRWQGWAEAIHRL